MPQIILNSNIQDNVTRNNRQKALQRISDAPVSNALLNILADWSTIKGAEEKIMKEKGKIALALKF